MGNLLSCRVADLGIVVLSDGTVRELDGPTPVAELMMEHPREFVVDLHALTAANYVTPLPADHLLDPDKAYVMLRMAPGKTAVSLSATEARQVLAVAKQIAKPTRSFLRALGGQPKAVGPTKEKEKVVEGGALTTGNAVGEVTEWCSEMETETEILMRQYSSRRWKPSLDTIVEKSLERQKMPHWLF